MPSGGKREGAGRPIGTGPWQVTTYPTRLPYQLYKLAPEMRFIMRHGGLDRLCNAIREMHTRIKAEQAVNDNTQSARTVTQLPKT